jgi:hypothetical protein
LGVSPASKTIHALDDWQIGLLYEVAIHFPLDSLRRSYYEHQNANNVKNIDPDDLASLGLPPSVINDIMEKG